MSSPPMVIGEIRGQSSAERAFAEDNDMVQTLAADRANHTLDVGALPRRPWSRQHLFDSHRFPLLHKLWAENPVAIPQQIPRGAVPGKGFSQLVCRPFGGGMGRDSEVENTPPVVCQDQKH